MSPLDAIIAKEKTIQQEEFANVLCNTQILFLKTIM